MFHCSRRWTERLYFDHYSEFWILNSEPLYLTISTTILLYHCLQFDTIQYFQYFHCTGCKVQANSVSCFGGNRALVSILQNPPKSFTNHTTRLACSHWFTHQHNDVQSVNQTKSVQSFLVFSNDYPICHCNSKWGRIINGSLCSSERRVQFISIHFNLI